jgi:hypothetical protein
MSSLEDAIAKIRSVGQHLCENQGHVFPDYDHMNGDATAVCERLGIPFTDDLFIEYPTERTFCPIDEADIAQEEQELGVRLPSDYKTLLNVFGEFHLPGNAVICIESPLHAAHTSQGAWQIDENLTALAISSYNVHSDGNSIGFLRQGDRFGDELFEFNHELRYHGDDPTLWTKRLASSLSEFIVSYIDQIT